MSYSIGSASIACKRLTSLLLVYHYKKFQVRGTIKVKIKVRVRFGVSFQVSVRI